MHFTLRPCPSGAYDGALHEVLQGTARFTIGARSLRITGSSGTTIDFTAE